LSTVTLLQICQDVADYLEARESGTATGGSVSTVVSAAFPFKSANTGISTRRYVGGSIVPTVNTYAGLERGIITHAPTTGTFTVDNNWGGNILNGDTFDIYLRGISYTRIAAAVNRGLGRLYYHSMIPLSLINDCNMESSATTSWTSSDSTHTKVATSTAGGMWRGGYVSRVLCTGANGYIQSNTIACSPGDSFMARARVAALVGTGKLVAYDVTNSAEIISATWDDIGIGNISYSFTAPSTCEQVALRLQGVESNASCYWDDVILVRSGANEFALPSGVVLPWQLVGVYSSLEGEDYDYNRYIPVNNYRIIRDELNQMRIILPSGIKIPVVLNVLLNYATLSTYNATTTCDKETAKLAGLYELLRVISRRPPGQEVDEWKADLRIVRFALAQRISTLGSHHIVYETE
jgi:hypothetical protein